MQIKMYGQEEEPQYNDQAEEDAEQAKLYERFDALCNQLIRSRSEAIDARQQSGIENEWMEDEEYYEGIDDANRGEMSAWRGKPLGTPGLVDQSTGSTVFVNITRPYCDAAAARTADVLMSTDDRSWYIDATPIPELVKLSEGELPPEISAQIGKMPQPEQETQRIIAMAQAQVKAAREKSEKASKRIEDWQTESQYHATLRAVIGDAAKVGSGILKGPIPERVKKIAYIDGQIVISDEIKPVSRRIDYWNFFPAPGCGEDIHDGSFTWEKDDITARKLEGLIGAPGYFEDQIKECLKEGAQKVGKIQDETNLASGLTKRDTKNLFEIWYYHGQISKEDFLAANILAQEEFDSDKIPDSIYAQVTMVNNHAIRVIMNPLDTGDFPYDVMVWQVRKHLPWGMGIARQVRTPQRIVNAAARNLMDNAGRAAGPQVVIDTEIVQPENGIYEITPWKIWRVMRTLDGTKDIDSVFRFVTINMYQSELQNIINTGLKLAEDVTGLPMIMMGQMSAATPDTLGGMKLQNDNAGTVLRRVAKLFDDRLTEPHIRRYYTYLLQYGPDDEKGDFIIYAQGSSSLVERDVQGQQIQQMGQLVGNPIYGIDPKKFAEELFKSWRLDPTRFQYDDEEWKAVVEKLSQPPQDSSLQVAQIRADVALQTEQLKKTVAEYIQASKEAIEERKLQVNDDQFTRQMEFNAIMATVDQDIIAFQEQNKKGINDDALKTRLAETVMKLRPIYEGMKMGSAQLPTPPTEPAGTAPNGESYQK